MSILRMLTVKYIVSSCSIYSEYSDEHSFNSAIYRSRKNFWTFAQKLYEIRRITRLTLGFTCFNCSKIFASLFMYSFQNSDVESCSVFFTFFSTFDRSWVCWVAIPRIFDDPALFSSFLCFICSDLVYLFG